jgi:hypothetical protein
LISSVPFGLKAMNFKQAILLAGRMTVLALALLVFSTAARAQTAGMAGKDRDDPAPPPTTDPGPPYITIGALVFAALAGGYLLYHNWKLKQPDRFHERQYHFHCPKCKSKIGYSARRVGSSAKCRTCDAAITFPPPPRRPPKRKAPW